MVDRAREETEKRLPALTPPLLIHAGKVIHRRDRRRGLRVLAHGAVERRILDEVLYGFGPR
jgi:hypothetical protein